jgi:hypothetical protein
MKSSRSQLATDFMELCEAIQVISDQLSSPNLTDYARQLLDLKLIALKGVIDTIKTLHESKRLKVLVGICLTDGKCSSKTAEHLGFRSIGHMRYARNDLSFILSQTVLDTGIIHLLLQTQSIEEVREIINWYQSNVLVDDKFLGFIKRYGGV